MSQDFAKKRTPKKRATATKKKPAAKKSPAKPARKKAARPNTVGNKPPMVLWVAAFAATIALLLGLYLLAQYTPRPDTRFQEDQNPTETRFDFFTTLPEAKIDIEIPDADKEKVRYEYLLQAGSFKNKQDAESRKAELALMGYQSHISAFDHNGARWFRVQIGPLDTRSKVAAARTILFENGVNTWVMKNKLPAQQDAETPE